MGCQSWISARSKSWLLHQSACVSSSRHFVFKGKAESPSIGCSFDSGSRRYYFCVSIRLHSVHRAAACIQLWLIRIYQKRTSVSSAIGLTLETFMIMPIAMGYLLLSGHIQPAGAESGGAWVLLFLPVCLPRCRSYCLLKGRSGCRCIKSVYYNILHRPSPC